jgi:uncharacterized membrane protein
MEENKEKEIVIKGKDYANKHDRLFKKKYYVLLLFIPISIFIFLLLIIFAIYILYLL